LISFTLQGKFTANTDVHIIQEQCTRFHSTIERLVCGGIIGPAFFKNTCNFKSYVERILFPFFEWLKEEEHLYPYIQQYSSPAHMTDFRGCFEQSVQGQKNS
jgi:hypothetical protein